MPLNPTFSMCVVDNCGEIQFTDTTGVYHAVNNTGGWGAPNMQGNGVVTAVITFQNVTTGAALQSYNVLSQIPATVTGDIVFTGTTYAATDGIYEVTYTLTGTDNVSKTLNILVLCNTRCCIDKMWKLLPGYLKTKDSEFIKSFIDQTLLAEGIYNGIRAAGGCLNEDAVEDALERLEQLCNFENCNCN